jgi:predicted small secreted protein
MKKAIIIGLILLGILLAGCNTFDVGGNQCQADYSKIPQTTACTASTDCLTQLHLTANPDGVDIKCNAGICQSKISTCQGAVNP